MGTRYYDPALGRFTQVDPVAGGSPNRYDYAAQDSINHADLDGRKWTPFAGVGGGWVASGPPMGCTKCKRVSFKELRFISSVVKCLYDLRKGMASPASCHRFG